MTALDYLGRAPKAAKREGARRAILWTQGCPGDDDR